MDWSSMSLTAAQNAGIGNPSIFQSLIREESGFDPFAVSSTGRIGLGQVSASTAANPGFGVSSFDVNDPVSNLQGSANYFAALYNRYGSYQAAATAYNNGPGAYESGNTTNHYTAGFNSQLNEADQDRITTASDGSGIAEWFGQAIGSMFGSLGGGPLNQAVGGSLGSATSKFISQSGLATSIEEFGLRAAVFLIGSILLIFALVYLVSESKTVKSVVSTATKVAAVAA